MKLPANLPRKVAVTGLGFITPIGNDRESVEASLRDGRTGLDTVTFLENPNLPVRVAGTIKDFDVDSTSWREWRWPDRYTIPRETLRSLAPHGVYAICAIKQAMDQAGVPEGEIAHDSRTGLFCASAGSAMLLHHNVAQMRLVKGERGNPLGVVSSIAGTLNFTLAAHFHVTGAVCGFVSACASSSHALGYACDEIRLGRLDRAIVVGAEDLNADTLIPFAAMRALSPASDPANASRPFDAMRDGFVGAGGAVALMLEDADVARERGASILGELAGWGQAADGYSIAISHPEGAGLAVAMQRALEDAGTSPTQIEVVSAHATSTPVGDRAEAMALHRVFRDAGADPLIHATKSLTGHPLSMSGLMEAAFCLVQMNGEFVCGTPNLHIPDEACEGLRLPRTVTERKTELILNNSSGFGGSNVCHVLRRWS